MELPGEPKLAPSDQAARPSQPAAPEPPSTPASASFGVSFAQDSLLDDLSDAVILVDAQLSILRWNRAAVELYGWHAEQVVGQPISAVIPVVRYLDDMTRARSLLILKQQTFWKGEVVQHHRDGHELYIESSTRLLRDSEGQMLGIIAVNRDISARKRAEQAQRLIADASALLAASLDIAVTCQSAARLALPQLADWCAVDLYAADGQLQRAASAIAADGCQAGVPQLPPAPPPPGWRETLVGLIGAGRPLQLTALPEPQRAELGQRLAAQLPEPPPAGDALIVPFASQQVSGALTFVALAPRRYDAADRELAQELTRRASAAIDQARLYAATQAAEAEARRMAARLQTLVEASQAFAEHLDLTGVLDTVVRRVVEIVGDGCAIRLLSEDGELLLPGMSYHHDPAARGFLTSMLAESPQRISEGFNGQVIRSRQPLLASGLSAEQIRATIKPEYWPYVERFGVHSIIVALLRAHGRAIGTLTVVRDATATPYTAADLMLVQDLADRAAQSIEQARLYDGMQAALREQQETLALLDTLLSKAPIGVGFLDRALRYVRINETLAAMNGLRPADHLGRPIGEVLPELRATLEPLLERVLATGQPVVDLEVSGETPAQPGQLRHWLANYYPVRAPDGSMLGIGLVVVEISERKRAEQAMRQLYYDEQRARQMADILSDANLALTSTLDLDSVLAALLEHLRALVPYDRAHVMLLDADGALEIRAQRGYEDLPDAAPPYPRPEHSPLAELLQHHRSVLIDDTAAHAPAGRAAQRSWLGVPLLAGGELIGLYALEKTESHGFTAADVHRAETLAAPAAVALDNARLFAEVRAGRERLHMLSQRLVEVQESERSHLARELHDEIGQTLTGLNLVLEVGTRLPPELLKQRLAEAQGLVNELTARVRELSLDLRPAMLDDLGLLPALEWHFKRFTSQTRIVVHAKHAVQQRRLPLHLEVAAYRIVQEALTNVARHAGVAEVTVRLWTTPELLAVQIEDHGPGFDPAATIARGLSSGLVGMHERAELLGGSLTIESQPGVGTRITAELPLVAPLERRGALR